MKTDESRSSFSFHYSQSFLQVNFQRQGVRMSQKKDNKVSSSQLVQKYIDKTSLPSFPTGKFKLNEVNPDSQQQEMNEHKNQYSPRKFTNKTRQKNPQNQAGYSDRERQGWLIKQVKQKAAHMAHTLCVSILIRIRVQPSLIYFDQLVLKGRSHGLSGGGGSIGVVML